MKGANEILVEYYINVISDQDIVDWAFDVLLSDDIVSNDICLIKLVELKGIDPTIWGRKPEMYLWNRVDKYYADFKIPSSETEVYAKRALREKCAGYLAGRIKHTEAVFSVAENIANCFDNPSWIGDLLVLRNKCIFSDRIFALKREIIQRLQEL